LNNFISKILIVFLPSFIFLEITNSFFKSIKAEPSLINNSSEFLNKKQNKSFDKLSYNSKFVESSFFIDVQKFQNSLIFLIASNLINNDKSNLELKIDSNVQKQLNDIFYAEGNVIIYLSNARLFADKVTYDKNSKKFIAEGNLRFFKGNQYFEATKLEYNLKTETGFIENIYGGLDLTNINEDLELKNKPDGEVKDIDQELTINDLKYINNASLGLVNDFEEDKSFNISKINLKIPQIKKWRFKSDKIQIEKDKLTSKQIFFTNDAFNKPQFLIRSKRFSAEIVKDKLELISRNTRIIFDDKLSIPIGRRKINDNDPFTRWGIGWDKSEKDGLYIFRSTNSRKVFEDFELKLQPYFLLQRAIKGKTNLYVEKDFSLLSEKVEQNNKFLDLFALDANLDGEINSWKFNLNSKFNSLNLERLTESNRTELSFSKSIDLNLNNKNYEFKEGKISSDKKFQNFFDTRIYSNYREKITGTFTGDQEIYLAYGLSLANRRIWDNYSYSLIYDVTQFNAKRKDFNELINLNRNMLAARYSSSYPLWSKNNINKEINSDYKYYPKIIEQGINWESNINLGHYIYSDGSTQSGITFSSGPNLTIGEFKKDYFDYLNFQVIGTYAIKDGQSPFNFDDISDALRLKLNTEFQIFGPLLFKYESFLNLDEASPDYGKLKKNQFSLEVQRRAYSLGAYYTPASQSLGIQFNIFNFDYSGLNPSF